MHASSVNARAQGRRGRRSLSSRWLLGGGVVFGVLLGLAGFLLLDHPGWIGLWVALFLGLGWAGWDVRLRQMGELPIAGPRHAIRARPVKDGPFDMIGLAGGSFLMGSAEGDAWADQGDWSKVSERPQHRVTLSGYRIGRTPVTQGQWRDVMGQEGWSEGDDELPVTAVLWYDAVRFCNDLSRREGYQPCYRRRGVWPFRRWACDWSADGYRLPTEAEWEYACRAGTDSPWSHGDDPDVLGEYAWYAGNAGQTLHPVAQKRPNPWGIYDMHGNVWEWCWDWYGSYPKPPTEDPRGPSGFRLRRMLDVGIKFLGVWTFGDLLGEMWAILRYGPRRVLRGGSFGNSPEDLRSAVRFNDVPEFRNLYVGFRCVRVPARQD